MSLVFNKLTSFQALDNALLHFAAATLQLPLIESLRAQGEVIENETLAHISLLPYRHVVPNGTYFIDDL
jgi:hypothetical protein